MIFWRKTARQNAPGTPRLQRIQAGIPEFGIQPAVNRKSNHPTLFPFLKFHSVRSHGAMALKYHWVGKVDP